ncbi:hypothetical protein BASA60_011001 [Batrachochytrium salamandrivorans]|nr:hypothetical protein BASA60_011001 [Batrachochytrium salamandrivorans]
MCRQTTRQVHKFLRSPALSTGQAIGRLSSSHWPAVVAYGTTLGHSRQVSCTPQQQTPTSWVVPACVYSVTAHLDCKPMAHLVVRLFPPHCVFCSCRHTAAAGNQRHACANFDCTCTPHPLPHQLASVSRQHPATAAHIQLAPRPYGIVWIFILPSTTTSTRPGPLLSLLQVPLAALLVFHFFIFQFSPHTRFEPPISVAHSEIPRQAQDTVEENPTGSRTTTTDTHTAAISSTPTPTHISYIGSDDILTVLLGGSLPGTNTAGNTEACPGQQWLTGTVEEGNLLCVNQPVAHRMCDFLQISVRVYRAMLWKHHKSNLSHIPDI